MSDELRMTRHRRIPTEPVAVVVTAACAAGCGFVFGIWRGLFLAVNVVAFGYYGFDKYQAIRKSRRVPEVVLLAFAAACGVPGSLLGQIAFNHKTSKSRFRRVFWTIAILQAIVLTGLIIHGRGSL